MKDRIYIAIDLKSFYASVECRERGLDPLDTNLVVADISRTDKTICLAVTPSLKSFGMSGRSRLFEGWPGVRPPQCRRAARDRGHERGCIFPGGIQMLKQLLKYEFKATGRTYGGLYLALVALAVLSGFSLRSSSKDDFASLLLFAYMVVAVAVAVVSVMTIVTRFTRNLLGREGYLMHTLPVTESQLILSKLISSVVWMLCSSIVGIFSFAVMLLALSLNSAALQQLPELWQKVVEIFRMTGSAGWLWLAFEALNGMVALVSSILCIYAACMIGHQFKKHMVPAGILAFFLLSFLQNWLSSGVSSADMLQAVSDPTLGGVDVSIAAPSAFTTLFGLAVSIAFAAGYFLLTRWLMEHKLDLE